MTNLKSFNNYSRKSKKVTLALTLKLGSDLNNDSEIFNKQYLKPKS